MDAKKKSLAASERHEEERASFREQMKEWEARAAGGGGGVWVHHRPDAAGCPCPPSGQRATDRVPGNRGKKSTLLACLTLEGRGAAMILEGAANGAAFEAYVEHILVKSLQPGQIVVMENLRVQKTARVRQLIEEKGCQLRFLPAYSPDFSPLEEAFSKLKTGLRRRKARTREALEEALTQELLTVTSQDACGWFEHCG